MTLEGEGGKKLPIQTRVLDRWSDGSVRWLLADWRADASGRSVFFLKKRDHGDVEAIEGIRTVQRGPELEIDTGAARFVLSPGDDTPLASVMAGSSKAIDPSRTGFTLEDRSGAGVPVRFDRVFLEEAGPLRVSALCTGRAEKAGPRLNLVVRLRFYLGSPTVRFDVTLHNPNRQRHRGGIWLLGDKGSIYFRDFAFTVALPEDGVETEVRWSLGRGADFETCRGGFELYQDSSGGANWRSRAHVNRHGQVPNRFRGYRLRAGRTTRAGRRATPVVCVTGVGGWLALAVPQFWQNFPKALEAGRGRLTCRLFPGQYADVHELQGGEQKTHRFFVSFAEDRVTRKPLHWCLDPLVPHVSPRWYCESGVVPDLLPRGDDPNRDYVALVDCAIYSKDSFFRKREVIDEYGWRNFGDLYADHETAYHHGPEQLVSHYNNQYDALHAFLVQFLRSSDRRWMTLACDLAAHVADIDVYHTEEDRAGYNGGLHWHTSHYTDAGTSSHRGFTAGSNGGGPTSEHCYNRGLMLHYFLTGEPLSREVAVGLGYWVVHMEDGRKTIFRFVDQGPTGWASVSGSEHYHGPGRGAGNTIAALMAAHRLCGDPTLWEWAERLIRRCIHPCDDVAARDLLNVEARWFYTVFLQTLGAYLDEKIERGERDDMYAYARESLLRYARWMAGHEYPYLEKPEILEFPNDTWSALEIRKSEVFLYAARHAKGAERERFLERADFFFEHSVRTLTASETKTYTRLMVIVAGNGYRHGYFKVHPDLDAPEPSSMHHDFGSPEVFVMQKHRVRKKLLHFARPAGLLVRGLRLAARGVRGG